MRRPQREPSSGLPERVTIYEVGPRDGLQNEKTVVPAAVKAEFVRRLVAAGLARWRRPRSCRPRGCRSSRTPRSCSACSATRASVRAGRCWCPTRRAWTGRSGSGVSAVAIFGSATETFARKNLNRSVEASVAMFAPVVERARAEGVWVRAYVSMCFGDPWEGDVPVGQVVDVAQRLMDLGCDQLSIGDTIGVGTTGHVHRLLEALDARGIGPDRVGVHFHDTYGQALANTLAALADGVTVVDASTGGLGGCPVRRSATGNLATEDLVWALDGAGHRDRRRPRRAGGDQRVDGRAAGPPLALAGGQGAGGRVVTDTAARAEPAGAVHPPRHAGRPHRHRRAADGRPAGRRAGEPRRPRAVRQGLRRRCRATPARCSWWPSGR